MKVGFKGVDSAGKREDEAKYAVVVSGARDKDNADDKNEIEFKKIDKKKEIKKINSIDD